MLPLYEAGTAGFGDQRAAEPRGAVGHRHPSSTLKSARSSAGVAVQAM